VKFQWDQGKSDACFRERGFDFAYAVAAFGDVNRMVRQDTRRSYGEARYQLTGQVEGRLFVVVFTHRQGEVRIISARKAKQREVRRYEDRSLDD